MPLAEAIASEAGSAGVLAGDFNSRPGSIIAREIGTTGWQTLAASGVDWIMGRSCIAVEALLPQPAHVGVEPTCLSN